jgi:hypothetical protein
MPDNIEIDTSEVGLRVSQEVSNKCGHKVEFSKMYWGEGGVPERYIFVNGQRANLSGPVVVDPNSHSIEDAFIYSVVEAIRKQYNG